MPPSLNIAALSRRTGVAPDTLRKWELRYGVLSPERTPGGQRRYSERDVARVEWLRDRLQDGYRIGEAARILGGIGSAAPAADTDALPGEIVEAVAASDRERIDSLLDQAFGVLPIERVVLDVVAPLLERVGERWSDGTIGIAQEHLLSARLRARLAAQLTDGAGGVRGTAVLACGPGKLHDLGLLMLAVLLQQDGWSIEYLGADVPAAEAITHAASIGARVVCLSAVLPETAARLREELAGGRPDGPPLVVGGRSADRATADSVGATYTGEGLSGPVRRLRRFGA